MKKPICLLALLLSFCSAQGQVLNASFESHFTNTNILQHWGNEYMHNAWQDSLGNWHQDSVVYESISSVSDAHSGMAAMQLQNAFNYSQNRMEIGKAQCSDDSFFSAYVPAFTSAAPQKLHFWYKYFPISGDTATVHLTVRDPKLLDSNFIVGAVIADTVLRLTAPQSTYTYAELPLRYIRSFGAGDKKIDITITTGSESQAHIGSRLLVDDLGFDLLPTNVAASTVNGIRIHPNPVSSGFRIEAAKAGDAYILDICDALGRNVHHAEFSNFTGAYISTAEWSKGIYMIRLSDRTGQVSVGTIEKL